MRRFVHLQPLVWMGPPVPQQVPAWSQVLQLRTPLRAQCPLCQDLGPLHHANAMSSFM